MESMESFMARSRIATGHPFHRIPTGNADDLGNGEMIVVSHPLWVVVQVLPATYHNGSTSGGWFTGKWVRGPSVFRRIRRTK